MMSIPIPRSLQIIIQQGTRVDDPETADPDAVTLLAIPECRHLKIRRHRMQLQPKDTLQGNAQHI